MFWLSISSRSSELDAIAAHTRPWAILKKFWQFSKTYGEYQSLPPSQRRQFIIDKMGPTQRKKSVDTISEPCLECGPKQDPETQLSNPL